jgi:hypothetical protein
MSALKENPEHNQPSAGSGERLSIPASACEYAGIQQRWLVVFSQAAQVHERKTLEKTQAKELEKTL